MDKQTIKEIKAEIENSNIPLKSQEKLVALVERKGTNIEEDLIRRTDVLAILEQNAEVDKELELFRKILELPNIIERGSA